MRQYRQQHQLPLLGSSGKAAQLLLLLLLSITILIVSTTNTCFVNAFHIVQQQQLQRTSLLHNTISIEQQPQQNRCLPIRNSLQLFMASGGMGIGSSSSAGKKTNKKSSSTNTDTKSKGMGSNKSDKSKSNNDNDFNVQSSMSRLEKKYEEILKQHTKTIRSDDDDDDDDENENDNEDDNEIRTSEYVIAARAVGYVDDWVPIAQLIIARSVQFTKSKTSKSNFEDLLQCIKLVSSSSISNNDKLLLLSSISIYRRELFFSACLGSRIFNSIPRDKVQYSIESIDSFHKYIYDTIIDTNPSTSSATGSTNSNDSNNVQNTMTKQQARDVLQLTSEDSTDWDNIKKQYRTLSFKYHPDRFVGGSGSVGGTTTITETDTETITTIEDATEQFHKVRLAYETLQSGRTVSKSSSSSSSENNTSTSNTALSSWYASLGGKARTDFIGPLQLMSMKDATQYLNSITINSDDTTTSTTSTAICPVNPSMVQMFVTRATTLKQ